jgi:hypothetical protein
MMAQWLNCPRARTRLATAKPMPDTPPVITQVVWLFGTESGVLITPFGLVV